ncbi:MAG: sensor histidine kinase [Alphaproteobacteria bacterium]|nr:ActS/PrrB/RegB family redox-sensitive histidine kinase [Alphaproteobacteria bacterium]TAD89611.1 MAG: sensor histidine kinase [Alphaproteobacteria bacterium]
MIRALKRPLGGSSEALVESEPRRGVKVRTLLLIRWLGLAGQSVTLGFVAYGMGVELPVADCLALLVASLLVNVLLMTTRRTGDWLPEPLAALNLGFDILQLSALLYLTGGLQNPFSILIVAPIVVSATILGSTYTMSLSLFAVAATTLLGLFHRPLPWPAPGLQLPELYIFGVFAAIVLGIAFLGIYVGRVAQENRAMSTALAATQFALAREQRLSSLGALAAAVAHELGTPLGTIHLVARELEREVEEDDPIREDIQLLSSESRRCRDILAKLAAAPETEGGAPWHHPPLLSLVAEVIEQVSSVRPIDLVRGGDGGAGEPLVERRPETIHGLWNFIHNAAGFARQKVSVTVGWDARQITVAVEDDGPGFPPGLRERLGEPYISTRPGGTEGHMGLGVFIATTLLGRTGGRVSFGQSASGGARVVIRWRRGDLEVANAS